MLFYHTQYSHKKCSAVLFAAIMAILSRYRKCPAVPEAKAEFDKQMDQLLECYNKIADILTNTHEKAFLEQGMSEKDALNKAKELVPPPLQ